MPPQGEIWMCKAYMHVMRAIIVKGPSGRDQVARPAANC